MPLLHKRNNFTFIWGIFAPIEGQQQCWQVNCFILKTSRCARSSMSRTRHCSDWGITTRARLCKQLSIMVERNEAGLYLMLPWFGPSVRYVSFNSVKNIVFARSNLYLSGIDRKFVDDLWLDALDLLSIIVNEGQVWDSRKSWECVGLDMDKAWLVTDAIITVTNETDYLLLWTVRRC
jgi:hypothetical protein